MSTRLCESRTKGIRTFSSSSLLLLSSPSLIQYLSCFYCHRFFDWRQVIKLLGPFFHQEPNIFLLRWSLKLYRVESIHLLTSHFVACRRLQQIGIVLHCVALHLHLQPKKDSCKILVLSCLALLSCFLPSSLSFARFTRDSDHSLSGDSIPRQPKTRTRQRDKAIGNRTPLDSFGTCSRFEIPITHVRLVQLRPRSTHHKPTPNSVVFLPLGSALASQSLKLLVPASTINP